MRDLMHRMIGLRALAILPAIPLYAGLAGCASAPDETTAIVPDGQSLGGTLAYGETYDYFTLPAQLGELFNVRVEATRQMTLATANIDSFGQFDFGVATNAGNNLSLTATSPARPMAASSSSFR